MIVLGRITPTRVGKTTTSTCAGGHAGDHPHACGENASNALVILTGLGSPPRVWGKLPNVALPFEILGITPTRVGKTAVVGGIGVASGDHPHACGENLGGNTSSRIASGSPPRVWGKLVRCPRRRLHRRITPTRVGKTRIGKSASPTLWDHPHACGENVLAE